MTDQVARSDLAGLQGRERARYAERASWYESRVDYFSEREAERAANLRLINDQRMADERRKQEGAERLARWLCVELELDEDAALAPGSVFVLHCRMLLEEGIALSRFIPAKKGRRSA